MYKWKAVQFELILFADRRAAVEGNIQSHHRACPQHHLKGLQGGNGIEEGVCNTLRTKHQGFLCTGAEKASGRGPGAGTEPRTGGWDQGRVFGGLLPLRKNGAVLGRNSPKGFKPGS